MTVHLVGAGPGDPELITVGGLSRLRSCDAVVYDALVAPELVAEAPEHALCIPREGLTQEAVNDLLVGLGRAGFETVRLKGGDPFVFGRGGEEAAALAAAGLDFEVVPGVSAAAAAPAAAGIPVTHRGVSAQVTLISGHSASGDDLDYDHLAGTPGTLVLFMAVSHAEEIAAGLIAAGKDPATPAAAVSRATLPDQRVVVGDLASVRSLARGLPTPALIVIGDVVALREQAQSPPWESASAVASARVGMKFAQPCLVTTIAPHALPSRPERYQSQSLT
jgi:uroporphyrin-III C-methyltransferase